MAILLLIPWAFSSLNSRIHFMLLATLCIHRNASSFCRWQTAEKVGKWLQQKEIAPAGKTAGDWPQPCRKAGGLTSSEAAFELSLTPAKSLHYDSGCCCSGAVACMHCCIIALCLCVCTIYSFSSGRKHADWRRWRFFGLCCCHCVVIPIQVQQLQPSTYPSSRGTRRSFGDWLNCSCLTRERTVTSQ